MFLQLFLHKQPCCITRVLEDTECPPHDVLHSIENHRAYYDPLYWPELYRDIFFNPQSISAWLETALTCHPVQCKTCSSILQCNAIECSVRYKTNIGFETTLISSHVKAHVILNPEQFSSASYIHCNMFKRAITDNRLINGGVDIYQLLTQLPSWLFDDDADYICRLQSLVASDIRECLQRLTCSRQWSSKKFAISVIMDRFRVERHFVLNLRETKSWDAFCHSNPHSNFQYPAFAPVLAIAAYFRKIFGSVVFFSLRGTVHQLALISDIPSAGLIDFTDHLLTHLHNFKKPDLLAAVKVVPSWRQVVYDTRSKTKTVTSVVEHIQRRTLYLYSLHLDDLYHLILSTSPESISFPDDITRNDAVVILLRVEYGSTLFGIGNYISQQPSTEGTNMLNRQHKLYAIRKHKRRELKIGQAQFEVNENEKLDSKWPIIPSHDHVLQCLANYRKTTTWSEPPTCACCAQMTPEINEIVLKTGEDCYPPAKFRKSTRIAFELLAVKSIYTSPTLVTAIVENEFVFSSKVIDGLMLHQDGVLRADDIGAVLQICSECLSSLCSQKIPRFALANKLYRGRLPDNITDLTWVEEMVCSLYRNTAHVTRLYGSTDPSQPTVFHGNTCAHEMNIVSTAQVLPRTPSDINDMLSVVFIGSRKPSSEALSHIFRVRKSKVLAFLQWLKHYNQLYTHIPIDLNIVHLYPEDGVIPGLHDRIIHDADLDPDAVFSDETAGFASHPAGVFITSNENMNTDCSDNCSTAIAMVERMGVTDPETVKLPGRTFTASALKNLISDSTPNKLNNVDLIIRRSNNAVPEYNNPSLLPGMFPTLFPFGIGGFEDKERLTPLSLQQQAQYYFNIGDRSFRFHFSYMFVILNIIQRRFAHIHTHFTCRRSNFDSIARKLVEVSPAILKQLADKFEYDHSFKDLTLEQHSAMDLLKHVNAISARIPGSQASKLTARNEIRNYFGHFGLPHLFLTFNPSPAHSPIFLVMCGDKTINLNDRFPIIPNARERALMLAKDPVAAADFFEFCVTSLFSDLFGWDYKERSSMPKGGILGRLRAFYGTAEFTERGCLHGHFLIWLAGAPNPSDLHRRLEQSEEFQLRFFTFFESIIHHHLPDMDIAIESEYNPRTERPPFVPDPHPSPNIVDPNIDDRFSHQAHNDQCSPEVVLDIIDDWETVYVTEVKKCGEVLQRHTCRDVCHKYGNEQRCRFLFPHEVVEASYYDPESNSVILLCRDSTVNYFNPYILVFCRHNHDIKCILSGKSAKAAMFYITDYMTKMTLNTYETLSLMSNAVAQTANADSLQPLAAARTLLHKCISQFMRQQQIHAQQAARYIRGFDDTISSHNTIPMMSAMLLSFVKKTYMLNQNTAGYNNEFIPCGHHSNETDPIGLENCESDSDEDIEPIPVRIVTDHNGALIEATQVHHYWFRSEELQDMSFYDFCCFVRLEKKTKYQKLANDHKTRLGVLQRHGFLAGHPLIKTHNLVEHTNLARGDRSPELVPRIIGMSIPRESSDLWSLFALIHFKPFGVNHPLFVPGESATEVFSRYNFSSNAARILKNWNAIYECEDERDAERLRKVNTMTKESQLMTQTLAKCNTINNDEDTIVTQQDLQLLPEQQMRTWHTINILQEAGWFAGSDVVSNENTSDSVNLKSNHFESIAFTPMSIATWKSSIKTQEKTLSDNRKTLLNIESQNVDCNYRVNTNTTQSIDNATPSYLSQTNANNSIPRSSGITISTQYGSSNLISQDDILQKVETTYSLNERQIQAFRIISRHYIARYVNQSSAETPLRMLMTGPGGTGKTHVIKAVKAVMDHYGCGHRIRFLAPTGSAASNIDGMTVHKGLGLKICKKDGRGKGDREIGKSSEDMTILVSVRNKTQIREEWKNVDILLIDEVSLASSQLLCDIDQSLRFAKEMHSEWFGGITVIFAGDFYQYPPVGGTPLYSPIAANTKQSDNDIFRRLGRLAWKTVDTVIELVEQQRMKLDPEYASAVQRLRMRQSTQIDVELFNTRTIKNAANITGIDMAASSNSQASAVVSTNHLRELLNLKKALATAEGKLIMCASRDIIPAAANITKDQYDSLLKLNFSSANHNGALPGFLPLYESMPVVLRMRNISSELKITNGSQGIVRKLFTDIDTFGYTYCKCAIIEFRDCLAKVDGLPDHCFPIFPMTFVYAKKLKIGKDDKEEIVRITRHQLPIQPGFAITGHSAQGKTLPKVLTLLNEGGFAAYVAASRATSRDGICLINFVTLSDLKKPLPSDLAFETKRLETLAHNTAVKYGYQQGPLMNVFDPETETPERLASKTFDVKFLESSAIQISSKPNRKRKALDLDLKFERPIKTSISTPNSSIYNTNTGLDHLSDNHLGKRLRAHNGAEQPPNSVLFTAGCSWSAENWSCAYDTAYMSLQICVAQMDYSSKVAFGKISELSTFLLQEFEEIENSTILNAALFNASRDRFRDALFQINPQYFPRTGHTGTSILSILDYVFPWEGRYCQIFNPCSPLCQVFNNSLQLTLPPISTTSESCSAPLDVLLWNSISQQLPTITKNSAGPYHMQCPLLTPCILQELAPQTRPPLLCHPILIFELDSNNTCVRPTLDLILPCTSNQCHYNLAAIIYYGNFHFSARLLLAGTSLWKYDGRCNGGTPVLETCNVTELCRENEIGVLSSLTQLGTSNAHAYLYIHSQIEEPLRVS